MPFTDTERIKRPLTANTRRALVVCYSDLANDPRVLKQIDWLASDGWQVDSLGFGEQPPHVMNHFALSQEERSEVAVVLAMMLLPKRLRFLYLTQHRIPRDVLEIIDRYGAIVINEIDLLPWVQRIRQQSSAQAQHLHLDLHEFHEYDAPRGIPRFLARKLRGYHGWKRSLIGKIDFDSVSTVAPGIASLYEAEFGLTNIQLVLNSKPYLEATASAVDDNQIELLYHGYAQMERGLAVLLEAATLLDHRFSINMMLTGPSSEINAVKQLATERGVKVHWLDPVPMGEVSRYINRFDVEVIFYPPNNFNLLHSFPNKFFESLQARLAIVIGHSPSMQAVVERYQNGFIADDWSAADLAQLINSLDGSMIEKAKNHSATAAAELNEEMDRQRFLNMLA